ncbi:MAG: hypothetical protein AUK37_05085 [Rhodobacterales bacterium CG2_30_65_12]|nr:MAG: hypothetical protein AUK37_05085 [Rhodobacterales bacterium CG2_30_65_12]
MVDYPTEECAVGRIAPHRRNASEEAFALQFLARQLARTANGLGLLARFLHGGFLEMLLELHFTKDTLALQLLLQGTKRLIDVVITNGYLHVVFTTFPS